MPTLLVAFRLDAEAVKKLEDIAKAKGIKRPDALREAVKEYIALYIVGSEVTVGRLYRRVEEIDKRLKAIEDFLMKKGAESVLPSM